MRFPPVSITAVTSVLVLTLTFAALMPSIATATAKHKKRHNLFPPLWRLRSQDGHARSGDSGTGRGLMAKFMMFKSMFQQQPQSNNVIVITQPTLTSPTTTFTTGTTPVTNTPGTITTTTRLARDNSGYHGSDTGAAAASDAGAYGDAAPTMLSNDDIEKQPSGIVSELALVEDSNGVDGKIALGTTPHRHKIDNKNDNNAASSQKSLKQQNQRNSSFKQPFKQRKHRNNKNRDHQRPKMVDSINPAGEEGTVIRNNRHRNAGKRNKRKRKITKIETSNQATNAEQTLNSNMQKPNINNFQDLADNNVGSTRPLNDRTTSRLQSILNVFRRPQTPITLKH